MAFGIFELDLRCRSEMRFTNEWRRLLAIKTECIQINYKWNIDFNQHFEGFVFRFHTEYIACCYKNCYILSIVLVFFVVLFIWHTKI